MDHKILAIEDDKDALSNLRDILELDGFQVTGFDTLKAAIENGHWSDYDVVLLDRKLPDGTADEMLPRIREAAPLVPVIVITGYADLEGTISALRAGASDYLLKPVNPDLLRAAILRAIKIREMEEKVVQSERLAAIGQMMAVLTHESANVLARGGAVLEMLESEVAANPAALELIERLRKSQTDLQRLYNEVRNYAAPIELDCERWNLATVWRQTWKNVGAVKRPDKQLSLVEQISTDDLKCEVDGFRMDQVFRNLFENAIVACSETVRIEIVCSDTMLAGRPALRIVVRDNGSGLPPEKAQKIFMPFFTTKQKGTGLGLAIVKRVVESHGGTIVAQSAAGGGAEFVLELPRRRTDRGSASPASAPESAASPNPLTADTA